MISDVRFSAITVLNVKRSENSQHVSEVTLKVDEEDAFTYAALANERGHITISKLDLADGVSVNGKIPGSLSAVTMLGKLIRETASRGQLYQDQDLHQTTFKEDFLAQLELRAKQIITLRQQLIQQLRDLE